MDDNYLKNLQTPRLQIAWREEGEHREGEHDDGVEEGVFIAHLDGSRLVEERKGGELKNLFERRNINSLEAYNEQADQLWRELVRRGGDTRAYQDMPANVLSKSESHHHRG